MRKGIEKGKEAILTSPSYLVDLVAAPQLSLVCDAVALQKCTSIESVRDSFGNQLWIYIGGVFDGYVLHRAHESLLYSLSRIAPVCVGLENDEAVRYTKGFFRPVVPLEGGTGRMMRLARLPVVSRVFSFIDIPNYLPRDVLTHSDQTVYMRRMNILKPPMIAIDVEDPLNPYSNSLNGDAKRMNAIRLFYKQIEGISTSRSLGY